MAYKYMKICSAALAIKEMQIKPQWANTRTLAGWVKSKIQRVTNVGEGRKGTLSTLLVGCKSAASVKKNWEQTSHRLALRSSSSGLGMHQKSWAQRISYLHLHVANSTVYSSQNLESIKVLIDQGMDKEIVVCVHKGML